MSAGPDVTGLLADWSRGDRRALGVLLPLVYAELRRMAARQLRRERDGHTLQPTALVHEAYLRLREERSVDWAGSPHFYGVAAQMMRRVLVDHARRQAAKKRGDPGQRVSLDDIAETASAPQIPVLALDDALSRLEQV